MPFAITLFDFDGTLADTAQCGIVATQNAFALSGLNVPTAQQIVQAMGIPIEQSFRDFGADALGEANFANLLTLFRKTYAEKADSLIKIFDGTLALLQKLHNTQKTAIVSSKKSDVLRKNADFLGIAEYVDLFVGSDKVNRYKPDPEGISVALAELGYQGERADVIYVGDATADIQMGHAAKIQTCAVTWGAHSRTALLAADPTYLADSFAELEKVLIT